MKMTMQMQEFSFVLKYALKMQVKKKKNLHFISNHTSKQKETYLQTYKKNTHTHKNK
jgi:predicted DNA-binding protein